MLRSITILLMLLFAMLVSADAQDFALFDSLQLGESTVEEVTNLAGKPKKKKSEDSKKLLPDGSYNKGEKIEILQYEKLNGWKKVEFGFINGKLISVLYLPKNKTLEASRLPELFAGEFVSVEGFSKSVSLSVFEGQKDPDVPKVYGAIYYMVSVRPERAIISLVNNGSWKSVFKDGLNMPTVKNFPGYIENIKVVRRDSQ